MDWRARRVGAIVAVAAVALAGCVVQEERPIAPIAPIKATAEIPEDELLDVAIRIFDPNIPADEKEQEKQRIFPDVCVDTKRDVRARFADIVVRGQRNVQFVPDAVHINHDPVWMLVEDAPSEERDHPSAGGR